LFGDFRDYNIIINYGNKRIKIKTNRVNKVLGFRVSQSTCLDDNGLIDSID
jgi:hypothetical protein